MKPTVLFSQVDPKGGQSIRAELGNGYVVPTANGGWQVVSRPRRVGISDYQGPDPIAMDIPIVLDGTVPGRGRTRTHSQEPAISRLYQMMLKKVGPRSEPAVIQVSGVPIPFYGLRWVINSITPGDEIRREEDGHRIQAAMTVSLLEYVSGDVIVRGTTTEKKTTSPAKKSVAKHRSTSSTMRSYTVKHGDTLYTIAAKEYGKGSEWPKIASANGIRDPKSLRVGATLKIPAS